jgi:hypothetical protein
MPEKTPDDDLIREEEAAAASDAARIGGRAGDEEDFEPEMRPVYEAGGGEAEGFEEAEAELIERAENAHGPSPIADAEDYDEEAAALDSVYGEADAEHTSEDDPGESDR